MCRSLCLQKLVGNGSLQGEAVVAKALESESRGKAHRGLACNEALTCGQSGKERKGGIAMKQALIVLCVVGWLSLLALAIHWQSDSQRVILVVEPSVQVPAPVVQVPATQPIQPIMHTASITENRTENVMTTVGAVRCSFTVVSK